MEIKPDTITNRLYTTHGKKMIQGVLIEANGKKAIGTFEGDKIVGYTTLDELQEALYKKDLKNHDLNF